MRVVVDSSMAIKYLVDEPGPDAAREMPRGRHFLSRISG